MTISALAGKPAPKAILVDLIRLEREYYARKPDMGDPNQLVESIVDQSHLDAIVAEARAIVDSAMGSSA